MGLIRETGKGESSGGKRPILLRLCSESWYAVGIDLADEDCVRGVLCTLDGRILRICEEGYENRFETLLEVACRVTDTLLDGIGRANVLGIGFSVSGVVDENRNEVIHSSNFAIENRGLGRLVSERFSLPVVLANRPNAAALAERVFGVGRNYRNLVYLTTGLGFGAGILHNGAIFSGSFGGAGEIGKTIVDMTCEPPTGYPNPATLEHRVRASYMLEAIRSEGGRDLSYSELLRLFHAGDSVVVDKVRENAFYLAYGAGIIANVLNPEVIILGGRIREFGPAYLDAFRDRFDRLTMASQLPQVSRTRILSSNFGREGIALGGAVLILSRVFNFDLADLMSAA
jgi:predicted NBD/HSP70 family sugar kinase